VGPLDRFDHLPAGVPRIHQDDPDRRGTALEDTLEHLQEVIDLAAAITLWIKETKIENPAALQLRVDLDTGDDPNAGNHCMGVAASLSSYHFNEMGMSLVEYCVVKQGMIAASVKNGSAWWPLKFWSCVSPEIKNVWVMASRLIHIEKKILHG